MLPDVRNALRSPLLGFPNPVNEVAARVVATGVVAQALLFVLTGWRWLLVPLALGFAARVAAGPRFSPLGRLATQVIVPRLGIAPRLVAGPPKRFAQAVGLVFSSAALVAAFGPGGTGAARVVILLLAGAAALEAFAGLCLGCRAFALLQRAGLVPASVCEACADISRRGVTA